MNSDDQLIQQFACVWPHLDEHARRLVAASKAVELGYGGISRVSRACGLSRVTLTKGVQELQGAPLAPGRIRRAGGGRRKLRANDPGLLLTLDALLALDSLLTRKSLVPLLALLTWRSFRPFGQTGNDVVEGHASQLFCVGGLERVGDRGDRRPRTRAADTAVGARS